MTKPMWHELGLQGGRVTTSVGKVCLVLLVEMITSSLRRWPSILLLEASSSLWLREMPHQPSPITWEVPSYS